MFGRSDVGEPDDGAAGDRGPLAAWPGAVHYGFAAMALAVVVARVVTDPLGGTLVAIELLPTLALAVAIAYAGRRFARHEPTPSQVQRSAAILCGGGIYGAVFVAVIELFQWLEGSAPVESDYLIAMAGFGGVALAAGVSHYYVAYEVRLAEARAESARANRLRKQSSVLGRIFRHNVRNEVNVVAGWIERTADPDPIAAARARRTARAHAERLADLSETARRIQRTMDGDERVRVDLVAHVESAVATVRAEAPAVSVATDLSESAWAVATSNAAAAPAEALSNAVEHNDPESLSVDVSVRADGEGYRVEIADDGTGIPSVEVDALDAAEEGPTSHGRGLGLYLMQTIAVESGGDMEVESAPGSGTTVRLWFPAADGPRAGPDDGA
ncbi:sensor histidine kinase [Halobaculum sp. EA56]|uniref:sensor histidine kinase n=1 Tax=Halobaculum sp. EA56 TaxID=3421648 RepID=UPI003EBDBCE9